MPDLGPGTQVWGDGPFGDAPGGESAEVDDPLDAAGMGLRGEDLGSAAIGVFEVGTGAERVHQVVGDIDAAQSRSDRLGVLNVTAHRVDVMGPGMITQLAGRASHAADPVTGRQQFRHQPASDVPGGPGHEAVQRLLGPSSVLHHDLSSQRSAKIRSGASRLLRVARHDRRPPTYMFRSRAL